MFPLGLGYISACLKKTGYLVDGINLNHFEGQIKDILTKKLDEKKYDFVCTGGNALGYSAIEKIKSSTGKRFLKILKGKRFLE